MFTPLYKQTEKLTTSIHKGVTGCTQDQKYEYVGRMDNQYILCSW